MDIRMRVLTARLAERVDNNKEYAGRLRIENMSHYSEKRKERGRAECWKQSIPLYP